MTGPDNPPFPRITVVIPARNEAGRIGGLVEAVRAQGPAGSEVEVVVVDDGSSDATGAAAAAAGALVVPGVSAGEPGNPARARNLGAGAATGDLLVFLDADCDPEEGWLDALVAAHAGGEVCVGGSLALPPGLSLTARCDYYCGWYHVPPEFPGGYVPNHPPGNLSVRRELFLGTQGYVETQPVAYAHEELAWQGELIRAGHKILFEPRARVLHWNRPGFGNLLRRNYRWGYSAIQSKAQSGAARFAFIYRHPLLLILASLPLALISPFHVLWCWVRARRFEPLLMAPMVLAARLAWSAGFAKGGWRWMRGGRSSTAEYRPRWQ